MNKTIPDEKLVKIVKGEQLGMRRIRMAAQKLNIDLSKTILTSQDDKGKALMQKLKITKGAPKGLTTWQIPAGLSNNHALVFKGFLAPNAKVPKHSHRDNTVHMIVSGSMSFKKINLRAGDWMYIPKGSPYSLVAGELGCEIFYCWMNEQAGDDDEPEK